ncbi:hypothetical protein A6U89_22725 [Agrobacterium sp. B133/95]|nr:hypothetical protein A6U89_22725 [Agrobacterium sp. B133/95]
MLATTDATAIAAMIQALASVVATNEIAVPAKSGDKTLDVTNVEVEPCKKLRLVIVDISTPNATSGGILERIFLV